MPDKVSDDKSVIYVQRAPEELAYEVEPNTHAITRTILECVALGRNAPFLVKTNVCGSDNIYYQLF